jgi:AcrR family transcriptional regulator
VPEACCFPAKRGRPSVAEAEQLSGKILDASWDVLLAEGFESFTFDRIARHAHIGKATIYSRFASKYDLLHALLRRRIDMRRDFIMAQGAGLPLIEAFCLRAAEMLTLLSSPDGKLLERLIDWLDEEKLAVGQPRVRDVAYREAIDSISESFAQSNASGETRIADIRQAAEFWLEGLLGHARRRDSQGEAPRAENEAWSRIYAHYFFAGIAAVSGSSAAG